MVAFIMHAPAAGEAAQHVASELAGVPTAALAFNAETARTRFGADMLAVLLWSDEMSSDLESARALGAHFGHRLTVAAPAAARGAVETAGLANRFVEMDNAGVLGAKAAALISRQWALLRRAQTTVAGVRPRAALALERPAPAARRASAATRLVASSASSARPAEGGRAMSMAMRGAFGVATTMVIAGGAAPMIIARAAQPETPPAPEAAEPQIYTPLAVSAPVAADAVESAPAALFTAAEEAILQRVADLPPMPPAVAYSPRQTRAPAAPPPAAPVQQVVAAPAPIIVSFSDVAAMPAIAPAMSDASALEPQAAPLAAEASDAQKASAGGTAPVITTVAALQRFAVAARAVGPEIAERLPMAAPPADGAELSTLFVSWGGESE